MQNYIQSNISIHGLEFHAVQHMTDKIKKEVCEQLDAQLVQVHEVGIELPDLKRIIESNLNNKIYSLIDSTIKELLNEKREEIKELSSEAVDKYFKNLKGE